MKPSQILVTIICLLMLFVAALCSDSKTNTPEKVSTEKTAAPNNQHSQLNSPCLYLQRNNRILQ